MFHDLTGVADFCELVHNIDTDRVRMSEEVCGIELEDLLIDMTLLTSLEICSSDFFYQFLWFKIQ